METLRIRKGRAQAMWYVIQTLTGKEAMLIQMMENLLEGESYKKSFVIKRECVWRKGGHLILHTELLFPSYVFICTNEPEALFFSLKKLPQFTKFLGNDGEFWSVNEAEKCFLEELINGDPENIIRRISVKVDEEGRILEAGGVLGKYINKIVKQRIRKRFVLVETELLGSIKKLQIGIRLEEDE